MSTTWIRILAPGMEVYICLVPSQLDFANLRETNINGN